jgi:carbonic anhydrase/acetyltransferase-like protein (isoleucine patch superfamily)
MLKIILQDPRFLSPFNERARDLRIQNKPLWLIQRDVLATFTDQEIEIPYGEPIPQFKEACLVYRDNLYIDSAFIRSFLAAATQRNEPCRAAFSSDDPAFREHSLPLSTSYTKRGNKYLTDLWYYPNGIEEECEPVVVDMLSQEVGYYHVPPYIAFDKEDLVFQVPLRSMIAIDSWVHIFIADMVFGLFKRGLRFEEQLKRDPIFKLRILGKALYEGKQVLECSELVRIGRNCTIDPRAVIHGPTTIGDNVTINAGVVIENCIIGSNVNISQDCQLMLSVIGDGSFIPFRSSLFMSTLMENSMVAQNTCMQMCIVGRNSFIGAGSTYTDFNLLPTPIRARNGNGLLDVANRPVLGGCVGHNCRIGSGMIVFPARMIESDVVLLASRERRVIDKDVSYEDSDHHRLSFAGLHSRLYPRQRQDAIPSWQFTQEPIEHNMKDTRHTFR